MSLGVGNITTHQKKEQAGPPFAPGSAVNGVSLDALSRIVLGNAAGATDAILLDPREIPLAAFSLMFVDNVPGQSLGVQSTNVPGVLSFGLRFQDANFPADATMGMDPLFGALAMGQTGSGINQFFYFPGAVFAFSQTGSPLGGQFVSIDTASTVPFGATIPETFAIVNQFSNQGANPMGCVTQYNVNTLGAVYMGTFGPAYPEVALQNGCGIDTDVQPANFWMNFSNRSFNSAGFRWFHQIGLGAATQTMEFLNPGLLGIRTTPTAALHLPAGVAAANGSPFKYTAGVLAQTAVENGAKNFDGTNESIAAGGVTYILKKCLTAVGNLDFPNTAAQTSSDLTINVAGAAIGDPVTVGIPAVAQAADICITGFVSAPGVVTVRLNNYSAAPVDIAPGDYRVTVEKLV